MKFDGSLMTKHVFSCKIQKKNLYRRSACVCEVCMGYYGQCTYICVYGGIALKLSAQRLRSEYESVGGVFVCARERACVYVRIENETSVNEGNGNKGEEYFTFF